METLGYMAVDQYGATYHLPKAKYPRKALLDKLGQTHAKKMYVDRDGVPVHIGYVIGGLWLRLYSVADWAMAIGLAARR